MRAMSKVSTLAKLHESNEYSFNTSKTSGEQ